VVHRFDTGGLENGLVNLINHMPQAAYRHAVLALTEVTDFRLRVQRDDVEFMALHKAPGHGFMAYPRVWRLLRGLRPTVVHTRNLGPLEMQVVAAAAGVPVRIHGEHGRELNDLDGNNRRLQRVRRLYAPFVHRYVALSRDLEQYLVARVGIRPGRVAQIYNGVDAGRFHPGARAGATIAGCPYAAPGHWLVGTVGRMQGVKNQALLARAFVRALALQPTLRERMRLVMVGEGPLRDESLAILGAAGAASLAWLPGERHDVADVMRGLNCFVLPSLAEGISNTILEAMATGLPVIATRVGGNAELVDAGRTGELVPSADIEAMAGALVRMAADPARAAALGGAGREEVERRFSLPAMVSAYQGLYDHQLALAGIKTRNT
jgi:sugar transferase (PEP-CTERM/EpsH1 system associated)